LCENYLSRVDNLMFTSYEGINGCFVIAKLLRISKLVNKFHILVPSQSDLFLFCSLLEMFCRRQQNNFRFEKYNYGIGLKRIFNTLLVARGCQQADSQLYTGRQLLISLIFVGVVHRITSFVSEFSVRRLNCSALSERYNQMN
jgi:hypothetical protein